MTIRGSQPKPRDGRHARSDRTRGIVAEAMLDCLEAGLVRPAAKEVAERAGVSTRAVFRHFDNMEALFDEAAGIQIDRVMGQLSPARAEGTLDQRIDSLVEHTARRNELVAPVHRAALLSEPFSDVIRERHAWMRSEIRRQLRAVFAPELAALTESKRRDQIAVLRALLSFSHWEELRRHERLSVAAASRVLGSSIRAQLRS